MGLLNFRLNLLDYFANRCHGRRRRKVKIKRELTMNLRKTATAAFAAVSLIAVPTVAMAAQAQSTSVSKLSVRAAPAVRQGARVTRKSNLDGGSIVVAILAVTAVIAGVIIAADGSNSPSSPA